MFIIDFDDCRYFINNEGGKNMLNRIWCTIPSKKELTIPHSLPRCKLDGISRIQSTNGQLSLDRIIIDDDISVISPAAFQNVKVREIHWPAACHTIPTSCFKGSSIEKITGIEEVTEIGPSAFEKSEIKELIWPEHCTYIPPHCFSGSKLESIKIGKELQSVGQYAFEYTPLEELDLSQSPWCNLCRSSLYGLSNVAIKFPYYTTEDDKKSSFEATLGSDPKQGG